MHEIGAIQDRLRRMSSVAELLALSLSAFETIRIFARSGEDAVPGLLAAFMSAAEAAVDGREAIGDDLNRWTNFDEGGLIVSLVAEARELVYPDKESADGPLGPLLLTMTFVTGLVDSFSYLALGHVFVANQTGNLVLLGLALAGARGFSVSAQTLALASFAVGSSIGGRIGIWNPRHRGRFIFAALVGELVFLAGGSVLAALAGNPPQSSYRFALIPALAIAMGIQTAAAHKLGVPDMTTTTTITGTLAATFAGIGARTGSQIGRRALPLAAILADAVVSGVLVVPGHTALPLLIAALANGSAAVIR